MRNTLSFRTALALLVVASSLAGCNIGSYDDALKKYNDNAPPPPPVFENLEAESAELLDRVRERQATQGVTRPEEERTAPPEPRTPEALLTQRGQNIDRFI